MPYSVPRQGSGRTEHSDFHPDSGPKIAEMDGVGNFGRGPGWMAERGPVWTRGPKKNCDHFLGLAAEWMSKLALRSGRRSSNG
jgi:hypothetical protein